MTLKLGGVLLLGLQISLRSEVVDTLNLESFIIIYTEIWLFFSPVVVAFAVGDSLNSPY